MSKRKSKQHESSKVYRPVNKSRSVQSKGLGKSETDKSGTDKSELDKSRIDTSEADKSKAEKAWRWVKQKILALYKACWK